MKNELETRLIEIIKGDSYIVQGLKVVASMQLSDSWIGAGFIRNKVWDYFHGIRTNNNDVDVIYFERNKNDEKEYELRLKKIAPEYNWSVKNQARMHTRNGHNPYKSTYEALSYWVETATCIAARIQEDDSIEIMAPYGMEDLFNRVVKPTPYTYKNNFAAFDRRWKEKGWLERWNQLKIIAVPTE